MLTRLLIACFCIVVWVCFLLWLDFALVVVGLFADWCGGPQGGVWGWCGLMVGFMLVCRLLFDLLLGGWFRVYIVL